MSLTHMLNRFFDVITRVSINDIVDILIVAYLIYKILMFIKDTRAGQLSKGVATLLVVTWLSGFLKLHTLYWILVKILEVGFILPFIIFQPELRAGLEHLGRNTRFRKFGSQQGQVLDDETEKAITELIEAVYELASKRTGALIVMEGDTKINEVNDVNEWGVIIDGGISRQILCNIFYPNTPLHDGAVIIKGTRICAAGCILKLTSRKDLSPEMGTRHRAAIGMSEITDSLIIVVSEETGSVSIARHGKIYTGVSKERLTNILHNFYIKKESGDVGLLKTLMGKK